ncbi:MAG: TRAP transporter large permease subunit, partial [Halobacteriovoraceae bacterium]|nr:TRAP transporter large permease subunit [Halobacteriovoraceae bacterium]
MEVNEILVLLMFISFMGLLFTGIPVCYVLAGVGVIFTAIGYFSDIYLDTATGLDFMTLGIVVNRLFKLMSNWVLVALPMFIFMGLMLDRSDVAKKMMFSMQKLLGPLPGGLAVTVTVIGVMLAASTGIIGASVVLLGMLSLPAMLKENYDKRFAAGIVSSAGTLGILIPPSIMLVVMADVLSVSVGDLFMGALFPGLLLAAIYFIYIVSLGFLNKKIIPPARKARIDKKIIWEIVKSTLPPFFLIIAVLGPIFMGMATPTEASGMGALGAVVLAALNKNLNFKVIKEVSEQTLQTTAFIFAIFIGATCFSLVLRELGGDEFIEKIITGFSLDPHGTLLLILALVFLLGFFLDWIEITLIILPLVAPIISNMDFAMSSHNLSDASLLWFTVLVALT